MTHRRRINQRVLVSHPSLTFSGVKVAMMATTRGTNTLVFDLSFYIQRIAAACVGRVLGYFVFRSEIVDFTSAVRT